MSLSSLSVIELSNKLKKEGKDLSAMKLEEMEKYWQWAKNEYLNT